MTEPTLTGRPVIGADGRRLGEIEGLLASAEDGRAQWLRVRLDPDGPIRLVPALAASADADSVRLPYDRDTVNAAPESGSSALDEAQARRLLAHYGLDAHG